MHVFSSQVLLASKRYAVRPKPLPAIHVMCPTKAIKAAKATNGFAPRKHMARRRSYRRAQAPAPPHPPTMLCARKLSPVPGVSQPPLSPLKPSVTAYITCRLRGRKKRQGGGGFVGGHVA